MGRAMSDGGVPPRVVIVEDHVLLTESLKLAFQIEGVTEVGAVHVPPLTDAEVAALSGKLDEIPAGGDGIVGALLVVFLVLLVTDIMGLTDVFPFVRN